MSGVDPDDDAGEATAGEVARGSSREFARVKELFTAARKLSPEERRAYLDRACTNADASLRAEVEAFLADLEPAAVLDTGRIPRVWSAPTPSRESSAVAAA